MIRRTVALLLLSAAPLAANVIFADNFNGSGGLNNVAPDTRPGTQTWVASPQFSANGAISGDTGGSATLAFTPVQGRLYTLDARFTATAAAGSNEWLALGFAKGQSKIAGGNERFIGPTVTGKSWMFLRGSATPAVSTNSALLGNNSAVGTASTVNWTNWTGGTGGTIELRIMLDTTGGTGTWKSTWYAKRPADATSTTVRPATALLDENIDSVGFARSNTAVTGTLLSLSLSQSPSDDPAPVAEPLVSFIPVTDGNPATDENGYAGSAISPSCSAAATSRTTASIPTASRSVPMAWSTSPASSVTTRTHPRGNPATRPITATSICVPRTEGRAGNALTELRSPCRSSRMPASRTSARTTSRRSSRTSPKATAS
jgi:hypothetical protein